MQEDPHPPTPTIPDCFISNPLENDETANDPKDETADDPNNETANDPNDETANDPLSVYLCKP